MAAENFCSRLEIWQKFSAECLKKMCAQQILQYFLRMAAENLCLRLEIGQKFSADGWKNFFTYIVTNFATFSRMATDYF